MRAARHPLRGPDGYAMAALLVAIAVMSVAVSIALPAWRTVVKREKEEELIFRGQQYVRAIELYQRKFANAYPPSLDVLLNQRFLRQKYRDPMTEDGEFQLLYQTMAAPGRGRGRGGAPGAGTATTGRPGEIAEPTDPAPFGGQAPTLGGQSGGPRGGIVGVVSKSTEESLRTFNGRTHYNEWQFVYSQAGQGGRGFGPGRGRGRAGPQQPGSTLQPGAPRGMGTPIRPPG